MTLKGCLSLEKQLLESVLENKGLSYVALQLMEILKKPIIITDSIGRVLVTQSPQNLTKPVTQYLDPELDFNGSYFYDEEKKQIFFPITREQAYAYLIVTDIKKEEIKKSIKYCNAAELALKFYFYNLYSVKEVEIRYKNEFIHDLLFNNISSMDEINEKSRFWNWDITKAYFVIIIELDTGKDIKKLNTYLENYLEQLDLDIISYLRNESIILICPINRESIDDGFLKTIEYINDFKLKFSSKIQTTFSIAFGQIHSSYKDIHKSYQEAQTAISIARILGESNFVKSFQELGVFRLLYKHDLHVLRDFYLETLGKIIENDKNNNGDLIPTLEALFDNNLDWKKTAEELFMHVNTLRYRIRKIEELLKIDFNKLENQSNLFIALKIKALLKNSYLYGSV